MARFIGRRIVSALIALWFLSLIVFLAVNVLPGDIAHSILGGTASPSAVKALNQQLGADRPLPVQYVDWVTHLARGDLGSSYAFQVPVGELIGPALLKSGKLALLTVLMLIPIGLAGGVIAALNRGNKVDRTLTWGSAAGTTIPVFVSAVVLLLVFGIWLDWFPVTATAPAGAGVAEQVYYLFLAAVCVVVLLAGYVIRVTRVSVGAALSADYTRTAYLKGLPRRTVLRRHVLRNGLLPPIAVIATETGLMFGSLVVVEVLFNYQGIGQLLFRAAQQKDLPLLEGGVMVVGAIFYAATLIGDVLYALLNPRIGPSVQR